MTQPAAAIFHHNMQQKYVHHPPEHGGGVVIGCFGVIHYDKDISRKSFVYFIYISTKKVVAFHCLRCPEIKFWTAQ